MRTLGVYLLLTFVAALTVGPFIFLLFTSLEGGDLFTLHSVADVLPNKPTLSAYSDLWKMALKGDNALPLHRFLLNTVLISIVGVVSQLVLSSLAAYPLARMEFRGRGVLQLLLLSTLMLPAHANMIINFVTIRFLGLYDTLLAVILPSAVTVFGIFLMRQAFMVVPRELEEAARLDGCNEFWIWLKIMLPSVRPSMAALAVFTFVANWNAFLWPLVVLKTKELYPLSVGLSYMSGAFDSQFRLVAAGSVLATLPIISVFMFAQRYFIKGLSSSGIGK